jgi:beta-lactamase class D
MRFLKQICAVAALCAATVVEAGAGCTLLQPLGQASKELQLGESCDQRESPGSTFKIPLALMGYDAGLLKSA